MQSWNVLTSLDVKTLILVKIVGAEHNPLLMK